MALKGFAFLIALPWIAALLSLIAASAAASTDATFWEDKFSTLLYRQAVGWDVANAWQQIGLPQPGHAPEWMAKVLAFSNYLQDQYPVSARLWQGAPSAGMLRAMLENRRVLDCPGCKTLGSNDARGVFGVSLYGSDWAAIQVLS